MHRTARTTRGSASRPRSTGLGAAHAFAVALLGLVLVGACGGGAQSDPPNGKKKSGAEPVCGNGQCSIGETCATCPADCGACASPCGDGVCGEGETCALCAADCGVCPPECGDSDCNGAETCGSCPGDCGACPKCGDDACNGAETCKSCPSDCGACPPECGDGTCNGDETWDTCAAECPPPPKTTWTFPSNDACDGLGNIGDGLGVAWTWVRSDTQELMWDDGTSLYVLTGTWVDLAGGALWVNGQNLGHVACGSTSANTCIPFFWGVGGVYLTIAVDANGYTIDNGPTWVDCPLP